MFRKLMTNDVFCNVPLRVGLTASATDTRLKLTGKWKAISCFNYTLHVRVTMSLQALPLSCTTSVPQPPHCSPNSHSCRHTTLRMFHRFYPFRVAPPPILYFVHTQDHVALTASPEALRIQKNRCHTRLYNTAHRVLRLVSQMGVGVTALWLSVPSQSCGHVFH
jgi:hypothetical protein